MNSNPDPESTAGYRQKWLAPEQAHCTVCGGPIDSRRGEGASTCDAWTCHVTQSTQELPGEGSELARAQRRRSKQPQAATAERDQAAKRLGVAHAERYKPSLLHAVALQVIAAPESRRRAFLTHVTAIIEKAGLETAGHLRRTADTPREGHEVSPSPLARCACALCAGACCQGGSDTGFLSTSDMLRVLKQHPGWTAIDLRDAYGACLPHHVIDGSCIFHTIKGCPLPEKLRSETCNTFECNGLRSLMHEFHENHQRSFCLFARRPHTPPRILFIDVDDAAGVQEKGLRLGLNPQFCERLGDQSQAPGVRAQHPYPC